MTTTRNFEAELIAAFTADRREGATLAERSEAAKLAEKIANDADAAGVDLWSRFYEIDEAVRVSLYPQAAAFPFAI